jgi:uncharacterized protein (DUF1778 family)
MSRPKNIVRREKYLKLRVTRLEKKWIFLSAEKAGLTASDFIRKSALNKEVKIRFSEEELALFKTLQQYHTNFSRIANIIKKNKDKTLNTSLLSEIEVVKNEIKTILKRFQE